MSGSAHSNGSSPGTDTPSGFPPPPSRLAHGVVRGAVAAMAMTGLREFTRRVGALEEPPPESIVRQRLLSRLRRTEHGKRRARVELMHWGYGAAGGAMFAALPDAVRQRAWSGPAYGVVVWLSFELGVAPLLGLSQARRMRPRDRIALLVDHLLYGFVLSETRQRPQD